jgi:hypothetical protein
VGDRDGTSVGTEVDSTGESVGDRVGTIVGLRVGSRVFSLGDKVGVRVGVTVAGVEVLGCAVDGAIVGASVSPDM